MGVTPGVCHVSTTPRLYNPVNIAILPYKTLHKKQGKHEESTLFTVQTLEVYKYHYHLSTYKYVFIIMYIV